MKCYILLFLIYSIFGTILHFAFKWSKKNIIVGIFSSINESVWEHIKLLLTPIFIYSFLSFLISGNHNYVGLFIQLFLSIVLIIIFYEIKKILFKDKYDFLNIVSFYVTCFIVSKINCIIQNISFNNLTNGISLILIIIIFIMYLSFSIFPPKHTYFKDPLTGGYGINQYVKKSV